MTRYVNWKTEARNLALLLLLLALLGYPFDLSLWFILMGALGYIGWMFFQLSRIQGWLSDPENVELPESRGMWGSVLDAIYRLQRIGQRQRKRLQARVDYLRDSFASLDEGAVLLDKEGNIEWSNTAAERLLGLRYPEDTRQALVNLIRTPEFIRFFESDDERTLAMTSPHNKNIELQISVSYFGRGSCLLLARDVTENHRLQQMRTDFVGNVSHELRTPLTVISGYLETLADTMEDDQPRWQRPVEQMLNQSLRMENLIKDLIQLSRIETLPTAPQQDRIAIRPMLEAIREEVLATCNHQRQISIECDDELQLAGSSAEIRSAFANLVMNAAKYTAEDGEISVRWFGDQQHLYLEVEDNGEGIERHHLPRLTERFYRVDKSRSIETGGTGLGLAIVKHILLHHQAELKITSVPGQGSVFSCVFPAARAG